MARSFANNRHEADIQDAAHHVLFASACKNDRSELLTTLMPAWRCTVVRDPPSVIANVQSLHVDVVVTALRFSCGEMTGLELVRAVRLTSRVPIMVYDNGTWTVQDRAQALMEGADDAMSSPFSSNIEFVARLRALVRRAASREAASYHINEVEIVTVWRGSEAKPSHLPATKRSCWRCSSRARRTSRPTLTFRMHSVTDPRLESAP